MTNEVTPIENSQLVEAQLELASEVTAEGIVVGEDVEHSYVQDAEFSEGPVSEGEVL